MLSSTRRQFFQHAAGLTGVGVWTSGPARADDVRPPAPPAVELRRLRDALAGSVVTPDDPAYDEARRVFYWNPRTETRPAVVVRCGSGDDVPRAVDFARRHGLEIAVRAGGHSHLGWGGSDGLVIDLSALDRVDVDAEQGTVEIAAGALSGSVARAAAPAELVPVLGQCPGVGAAGVTLGGGLGWLSGLFGACCDNLLAARIVMADGTTTTVDADRGSDLLWGLRGAGANFGVVTSFTARLHPLGSVIGGDVHYSAADARSVLRGFRDVMSRAPDAFQATLNLTTGARGVFISLCHAGDDATFEPLLAALRSFARPTKEALRRQPFADLAEKAAATAPVTSRPIARTIQTVYRDAIDDDVVEIVAEQLARSGPDVILGLSHFMHGAVCAVDPSATAFPHRRACSVHLRCATSWEDPAEAAASFALGADWLRLLRPAHDEAIYANYQTYRTAAGSPSIFGPNHARLLALKRRHDPDDVFRRNAHVAPAGDA